MAQHERVRTKLGAEILERSVEIFALGGFDHASAKTFQEMLAEEIELPHELLWIERDSIRKEAFALELGA